MIAIIDTNAYFKDVYVERQELTTLFDASDSGALADVEIWTPKSVVEELVRQFPERLERMAKLLGELTRDFSDFTLDAPVLPAHNSDG